jgi:hypothetical protein
VSGPYFESWDAWTLGKFARTLNEKRKSDEELMQQALEALEGLADAWTDSFRQRKYNSDDPEENAERERVLGAITALRERLTQPQRTHWEGCEEVHPECRKPEQREVEIEFKEWMHPQIGVVPVDSKTPLILKAHIREKNK